MDGEVTMTKEMMLSLIEDYASARQTGREALMVFAAQRVKEGLDKLIEQTAKKDTP